MHRSPMRGGRSVPAPFDGEFWPVSADFRREQGESGTFGPCRGTFFGVAAFYLVTHILLPSPRRFRDNRNRLQKAPDPQGAFLF
jgi:hypothetical protein